jgi:hypothetical protein
MLDYTRSERLASDEHSSLLIYEENEVLRIVPLPGSIYFMSVRQTLMLNRSPGLVAALGVSKFKTIITINLVTFLLGCLSPTLMLNNKPASVE